MDDIPISDKKIIELWQSPYYDSILLNLYDKTREYLLKGEITIDNKLLKKLKTTKKKFEIFIIKYINRLKSIIYKAPKKNIILYRGENRKKNKYKKGDILTYNNFHSTTDDIFFASSFSKNLEYPKRDRILYIIYVPDNFHYKKLTNKTLFANTTDNIDTLIDEKEYLIPPVTKYLIYDVTKKKLFNSNYYTVKMVMTYQKHNDTIYDVKKLPKQEIFNRSENNDLKIKLNDNKKYIDNMNSLDITKVNIFIYNLLFSESDIITHKKDILNLIEKININKPHKIAQHISKLGIGYYDHEFFDKKNTKDYVRKIKSIKNFSMDKVKNINDIILYTGFENYDDNMNTPTFFDNRSNNVITYDKPLKCRLDMKHYMYETIESFDGKSVSLINKKNNSKKHIYYEHICKIRIKNSKIIMSKSMDNYYNTFLIIIPSKYESGKLITRYKINSTQKIKNKYGNIVKYYDITMVK